MADRTLESYRALLAINPDKLDDCLIKQPELFDHVANCYTEAVADRDSLKLDLEEWEAEEAKKIRERASIAEEKLTEASLAQQLKLHPKIRKGMRDLLELKVVVDKWGALKESYNQRRDMLKAYVPLYLARLTNSTIGIRAEIGDAASKRISEERTKQREIKRREKI